MKRTYRTKLFDGMDLQWFADEVPTEESVEEEEDPIEYVTLREGEEIPVEEPPVDEEKEELKRRLAELEGRTSSLNVIQEGFNSLGDRLSVPAPPAQAQQAPQESDEAFQKRLNDELFGQNTYGVLKEAVQRIVGPMVGGLANTTMKQAKAIMRTDPQKGGIYKKYEKDIDAYVQTLPANVRANPETLEYAYNQIVTQNLDAIIEEQVNERVSSPGVPTPSVNVTTGPSTRPAPVGPSSGGEQRTTRKRVYITAAEESKILRQSDTLGIPVDKLREQLIEEKGGRS